MTETRNLLPAEKSAFQAQIKKDPVSDLGAAIHRLSQWAGSGNYPAGTTYDDLKWMYSQICGELKNRDPDSDAGGNFPAKSSQQRPAGEVRCKALTDILASVRARNTESKAAPGGPELELRKRRRASMLRRAERRGLCLEMRAKPDGTGGTTFEFEGYGAIFDRPFEMWDFWGDPYTEVVRPGAFSRTLAGQPDVPFLIGHDNRSIPLARTRNGTMTLSQDSRGLHVLATMDGSRSDVRNLASAVDRGDLDEMSIGFTTMGQEWSPDWETRAMTDLELHRGDVSAVALAANPATAGSTMTVLSAARPGERRAPTQPYTAHEGEVNECPQCHSVNDDAACFCDQCGTPMKPAGRPNMGGVEDMDQACPACGCWCSADAKFCGQCGQGLAGGASGVAAGWLAGDGRGREQLASHEPFTGRHSHAHPAYGSQGGDQTHAHDHVHDGDAAHDHAHASRSAGRPGEARSADEIIDSGGPPDSNVAANGLDAVRCPYGQSNGCGQLCPGGSKFCGNCGGPLYSGDGTLVLDDSGVVEAEGSGGDADLLALRARVLELA